MVAVGICIASLTIGLFGDAFDRLAERHRLAGDTRSRLYILVLESDSIYWRKPGCLVLGPLHRIRPHRCLCPAGIRSTGSQMDGWKVNQAV